MSTNWNEKLNGFAINSKLEKFLDILQWKGAKNQSNDFKIKLNLPKINTNYSPISEFKTDQQQANIIFQNSVQIEEFKNLLKFSKPELMNLEFEIMANTLNEIYKISESREVPN